MTIFGGTKGIILTVFVTIGMIFFLRPMLIRGVYTMFGPPQKFSFFYFESLPEKNIVPSAQEFVDKRFPPGSNIEDVTKELTAAGAECSNGMSNGERYYLCYYLVKRMSLIMIEWKIMIYLDKTETKINNISVNRGYTGP